MTHALIRYFTSTTLLCFSGIVFCSIARAEPVHLCQTDEQLIFSCTLDQSIVSLCASADFTRTSGYLQYRHGSPDNIQTIFPTDKHAAEHVFFLSSTPYSGGGANMIRFHENGQDIFLFDRMIRTHFVAGEPNYPEFSAGHVIRQDGQILSSELCAEADASIHAPAFEHLQREIFNDNVLP